MPIHRLSILLPGLALAACQALPPQDFSARPHASLVGSHVDAGGDRVDTFHVTALNGWPVNRDVEQDTSRSLGVDSLNAVEPGRPLRVEFEGLARYGNPVHSLFWNASRVEGSAEFVPAVDTRYVVRGDLRAEAGPTVWLEDERTHAVIGRKFTAAPSAVAPAPDMRTMTPGVNP